MLLGGAVVDGALGPLTPAGAAVGAAVVLVVRPLVGWLSLLHTPTPHTERWAIAFFGIRGVGSAYYLTHALNKTEFSGAEELWAITAFAILLSIVVHGVSAAPLMRFVDSRREHRRESVR